MANSLPSIPVMVSRPGSLANRLNAFLDKHVLPYPVKFLTSRVTILVTLCMLVPLIVFANVTVFVLATNSYLNVMSVVVSSTVLLYSTLSEKRDRTAMQRREEIAEAHQKMLDQRADTDHKLIQKINDHLEDIRSELLDHMRVSLDNIQQSLVGRLEKMQVEDHEHIESTHTAVVASMEAHRKELDELSEVIATLHEALHMPKQR